MDRKNNLDYIAYVSNNLTYREKLEAIAEESAELAQAALKVIRAFPGYSKNWTPKTIDEAHKELKEEVLDLLSVLYITCAEFKKEDVVSYGKWRRWASRLGYREDEDADGE